MASDLAILKTIHFRLADAGDKRDRNDARSVQHHLGAIETAVDRGSAAAVVRGARRLQALLDDRIEALEGEEEED